MIYATGQERQPSRWEAQRVDSPSWHAMIPQSRKSVPEHAALARDQPARQVIACSSTFRGFTLHAPEGVRRGEECYYYYYYHNDFDD